VAALSAKPADWIGGSFIAFHGFHLKDGYVSRCGGVAVYILVKFNKFLVGFFLM